MRTLPRWALATDRAPCQFAAMAAIEPNGQCRQNGAAKPDERRNYGLREGEIAAELPAQFDASLYYIGRIRTPWKRREDCPKNAPRDPTRSAPSNSIRAGPRASRVSKPSATWCCSIGWTRRGAICACSRRAITPSTAAPLRCARRRGPIRSRVSVVRLVGIDGNKLTVVGLDCLDDTPLLDIKPYFASTDSVPDASVGWHAKRRSYGSLSPRAARNRQASAANEIQPRILRRHGRACPGHPDSGGKAVPRIIGIAGTKPGNDARRSNVSRAQRSMKRSGMMRCRPGIVVISEQRSAPRPRRSRHQRCTTACCTASGKRGK